MLTKVTIAKKMTVSSDTAWEAVSRIGRLEPFPVTSYRGTVEVFESFDSGAVVVWTVDFESDPKDSATVAEALRTGIGAGVDGMERDLRSHTACG